MKKWLVGFACVGMLATTAWGQVASLPTSWSGSWTNSFLPSGWANVGLGNDYATASGGYDATGGGAARFDGANDALTINFDSAPGEVTYWARLNVGSGSWTTNIFKLQESTDGSSWSDVVVYDSANPIPTTAPIGPYTSSPSATARYLRFFYEQKGNGNVGLDGVTIAAGSGVVGTNIKFFASSALVNEDQDTYPVTIYKTVAEGDVSGEIALSGTATEGGGADYTVDAATFSLNGATTSTVITVTINDDAEAEAAETIVMNLANVVGAGTTAPNTFTLTINASDIPTHAIAIVTNAPENGTVTTTPEGTAEEGATVTVTATPAGGYRVASIAVVDGDSNPVTVTGNTFVMPTSDATVTVTFVEHASSALFISEVADPSNNIAADPARFVELYNSGASNIDLAAGNWYLEKQVNGGAWYHLALTGSVAAGSTYVVAGDTNFAAHYPGAPAPNQINTTQITGNGDDGYYLYSGGNQSAGSLEDAYGVIDEQGVVGKPWNYADARAVRNSGVTGGNPTWTAAEWTITPASMADMTPGVHPDGSGVFGVSFNKSNGFTVEQGTSDAVTATAANGVGDIAYSWTSTLGEEYRTAEGGVFTILTTAPISDYTATVTATDSSDPQQQVEKTISFSVVAPAVKYGIAIVTNAPENGTVTTDPATEAAAGATVTVNATPAGGYAVQSIAVVDEAMNPVTVTGNTFTMPAAAVTVTVTFQVYEGGVLIISQYYEGASYDKWIEIYNPGASAVDLAADGYRLGIWSGTNSETWKAGTAGSAVALTGSIPAGGTFLISHTSATNPLYATAAIENGTVCNFNGDDSLVLYTGETFAFANVVDAFGLTNNTAANKSYVRKTTVTAGVNTDFNAADWDEFTYAAVDAATEGTNERLGYHSTGPAVFSVSFDKADGFTVEQGTQGAITATATNGTPDYTYDWATSMAVGDYTAVGAVFTILDTAALGNGYTATVTATDSSDPQQQAEKTVTFSVATPVVKYAIGIVTNAPENGTVTTDPATEAAAGATVTVNATPAAGYAVGAITATESGGGTELPVVGNAFVMTNSGVMVSVTFVEVVAEGIVDFRFNNAPHLQVTIKDADLTVSDMALTAGTIETNIATGTYFTDEPYIEETGGWAVDNQAGAKAFLFTITPAAGASMTIDGISFKAYTTAAGPSAYGFDVGGGMATYEVNAPSNSLLVVSQAVAGVVDQTGAIEVKIQGWANGSRVTTGSGVFRLDDVVVHGSVSSGPPAFSVSLDKTNGFTVAEGAGDAITATPANGTEPIGYGWSSDLDPNHYTAVANVFTIGTTVPAGDYSATVYATNSDLATAQATVSFSVVGGGGEVWTIGDGSQGSTMFYAASNRNIVIVLPTNFTLNAVYGTDSSSGGLNNLGAGLGNSLTENVDYTWTPATRTINVLSGVTNRRVLRIGATPN